MYIYFLTAVTYSFIVNIQYVHILSLVIWTLTLNVLIIHKTLAVPKTSVRLPHWSIPLITLTSNT